MKPTELIMESVWLPFVAISGAHVMSASDIVQAFWRTGFFFECSMTSKQQVMQDLIACHVCIEVSR
jgi:hypothetical protein